MIQVAVNINVTNIDIHGMIENMIVKGGKIDRAVKAAVVSVQGEMLTRINENGLAADGSDIGEYSKKPLYVNPNNSPRQFPVMGKAGQTKFKSGKQHKTGYFAKGYDEFKTEIGRNIGKVNLNLTGLMRDSFVLIETSNGWGLGWSNDLMTKRALALEMKYGKAIFSGITDKEKNDLVKTIYFEFNQLSY